VCKFGFCNVWLCVCMDFVMCGCVYIYGFCKVWVCLCMGLLMCGCVYVGFVMCVFI